MGEVEAALEGNLSRCSGYRAVLEAFKVFTEKPNPEELATHEAKLPAALKEKGSLPMVLRSGTAEWHYVLNHSSVKALLKKEKNWVVVYGLSTGQQVAGKNVVIDVSLCVEKSFTSNASGLEVAAQTTVAGLADRLESLEAKQQSQMTMELVHVLRSVQTPQCTAVEKLHWPRRCTHPQQRGPGCSLGSRSKIDCHSSTLWRSK